ncbi:MAG TPA: enoyl-CoA hydratase/isomerase family protein [Acidimicrobiales bacterium]|nr:enoyl-CoA hydratase/isomerase family protein [Acidimicrobiales bacterium]
MSSNADPPPPVRLELDAGVAVVRLNRPPLNIYDLDMRDALIEAFTAVRDMPAARCLVLAAEGPHFSAGADLHEFGSAESVFEGRRIRWRRDPWGPLLEMDKPSVAALHGYALGAGLEMALLCDIRVAAPDTVVGLPETKLGMLPSAGGSQTLTRAVGRARALPAVLLGDNLEAAEALRTGVVHQVVDDVDGVAIRLARRLAELEPAVVAAAKRALRAASDLPLDAGLEAEAGLASALRRRG